MDAGRAAKRARRDEPIADDDDDEDQPEISSSESESSDEAEEEDSPGGGDDAMDEGYGDEDIDECMTDENAPEEREGGGMGEWIYPGRRTDGAIEPEQHQAASSDQDDSSVMRLFSRSGAVGHIAKDHPDLLAESNTLAAVSPPPLCADLEIKAIREREEAIKKLDHRHVEQMEETKEKHRQPFGAHSAS
ncbi:unnamed protein product [Vitrella brassicaformis CCMP3155]|uniref:Uncharacterized protein n=1 Tax=Vitrella brassicaformis (strain CCMP3155) TaxID=1169540 RepID=A0A0G4EG36_VITBC|nr:unnamed protein product [Vitrella brassicaformis CCMP3155]|eukprot:CEL94346.1 unnamed protein product [Vitrella brassicaformis CCMP3155]